MFLDVVESVNLLVNSNGTLVLSEVSKCPSAPEGVSSTGHSWETRARVEQQEVIPGGHACVDGPPCATELRVLQSASDNGIGEHPTTLVCNITCEIENSLPITTCVGHDMT